MAFPLSSDIDVNKPVAGTATTVAERQNWAYAKAEIEKMMLATGDYYTANSFNFVPGIGNDNTAAFASMHDAIANALAGPTIGYRKPVVWNMSGDFYADEIALFPGEREDGSSTVSIRGGPMIICPGPITANWIPRTSSKKVFCYSERGYIEYWGLKGIRILGIGATNPNQIGLFLMGEPKTIPGADGVYGGGLRHGRLDDVIVTGFNGPQVVIRGGTDGYSPTDLNTLNNVQIVRPANNHWPALMVIGQYAQNIHNNITVGGAGATNAGPHVYMGPHPSINFEGPLTDVTSNIMTASNPVRGRKAEPVRVIPFGGSGTVPTGLVAGTTYFLVPMSRTTTAYKFGVADTAALAFAGTLHGVSAIGNGCRFVKLWATALSGNEYTTEFAHLLATADPIRIWGNNRPTVNGTTATDGQQYWVVRTGWDTFKLATSSALAKVRTTTTITGGTLSDYGFMVQGGAGETGQTPAGAEFNTLTMGSGEDGMQLEGCTGIKVEPWFENLTGHAFVTTGPANGVTANLIARGGYLGNVAELLYSEGSGVINDIDYDSMQMTGATGNALHLWNSAQATVKNNRQQTVAFSAAPTGINWRLGAIINLGALTANLTSLTIDPLTLVPGCSVQVNLVQGGAGRFTAVLGTPWKGPTLGSGTVGQKLKVEGYFDGTDILYDHSGWDSMGPIQSVAALNLSTPGNTIVLFGDSTTAYNNVGAPGGLLYGDSRGHFQWLNALLDQRFTLLFNAGVSGDTTAMLLARITTDVLAYAPKYCQVQIGINDLNNGVSVATIKTNLATIYGILYDAGIITIATTIAPVATGFLGDAGSDNIPVINDWMRDYVMTNRGMILWDTYAGMVDPASAHGYSLSSAVLSAQAHQSTYGAYLGAMSGLATFQSIIPPVTGRVSSMNNSYGTNTASKQLLDNPTFQGSGGTNTPGAGTITGTIAANWEIISASGVAITASVAAAPVGNAQVLVCSATSGGPFGITLRNATSVHARVTAGDIVHASCEIDVSAVTGAGFTLCPYLNIIQNGSVLVAYAMQDDGGLGLPAGVAYRATYRTESKALSGSITDLRARVVMVFTGVAGATVKVSRMTLFKA